VERAAEAILAGRKRQLERTGFDSFRSSGEKPSNDARCQIVSVFIGVNDVRMTQLDLPHVVSVLSLEPGQKVQMMEAMRLRKLMNDLVPFMERIVPVRH